MAATLLSSIDLKSDHTINRVEKLCYTWKIHNFSFHSSFLNSPEFGANEHRTWNLHLAYHQNTFSLHLNPIMGYELPTRAMGKFSVLDKYGRRTNSKEIQVPRKVSSSDCFGFDDFITKETIFSSSYGLLPEDRLTLICEISYVFDVCNVSRGLSTFSFKESECKFVEDFETLIANKKFSDVKLVAGEFVIPAHKAILAVRSNVFAAMFAQDIKENKQKRIVIEDIDDEVLKEVLHFIYTGKVPSLIRLAHDILSAAHKYALYKLKVMCEKVLAEDLSVATAVRTLILADTNDAFQLKEKTLNYIKQNAAKVMATQAWRNMLETHPYLIGDAFASLVIN